MSRVVNLSLSRGRVQSDCDTNSVSISTMEDLPNGGIRLVCNSTQDAIETRERLARHLLPDDVPRAKPRRGLPYR
jgi:hypothetical protein